MIVEKIKNIVVGGKLIDKSNISLKERYMIKGNEEQTMIYKAEIIEQK